MQKSKKINPVIKLPFAESEISIKTHVDREDEERRYGEGSMYTIGSDNSQITCIEATIFRNKSDYRTTDNAD